MLIDTFRVFSSKLPPDGIPGVAKSEEEFLIFLKHMKSETIEYGYAPKLNYVVGQKPF